MSATTRVPLAQAERLAAELVDMLAPFCERVEIAGSIRRRKREVKDIELVVVPQVFRFYDMFEQEYAAANQLDQRITYLLGSGQLAPRLDKNGRQGIGERYKRLLYKGTGLDLFSVLPPAQFGAILAIRTGPAEFSQRLVTQRRFGGLMPDGWHLKDGVIWNGRDELVPTPEELDVFRAIGLDYIEPEDRR